MRLIVAACAALFGLPAVANDGIRVADPWIRALGGPGAAYLVIENHSDQTDRLLGAVAEPGGRADLHQSITEGGVSTMRPVEGGLPLPPGETVALAPGVLHLMIPGLPKLQPGATVILTLSFERAGEVTVEAPLDNRRTAAGQGGASH